MEPAAIQKTMINAAAAGDVPELRRLLAIDPGLGAGADCRGRTPLWWAAHGGKQDAVSLLLEAAPAAVLTADAEGCLPLNAAATAAGAGSADVVRLLLEAAPEAALAADTQGRLPLHEAAGGRSIEVVRLLLEAAPSAALTPNARGCLPLHYAAIHGTAEAVRLLLEAAPEAALSADAGGRLPLHVAAGRDSADAVSLLLKAAQAAALTADAEGCLPLHRAAFNGSGEVVHLLLEAALGAALTANAQGCPPLYLAALAGNAEVVRLLLEAAPAAALIAKKWGVLPLHVAAFDGSAKVVRLLLEVAPAAAARRALGRLPLEVALSQARHYETDSDHARYLESARLLLPATPPEAAVLALEQAGEAELSLFADLAACTALSTEQWQRVPAPCPALGAALPTVLARSATEAALLVCHLPAEARQRLRTAALCLGRAQREHDLEVPAALVGQVLALAARP